MENSLHWVLNVAFRKDESRIHKDHAPANMALVRHIALNLLKQEKTAKVGVKGERLIPYRHYQPLCLALLPLCSQLPRC